MGATPLDGERLGIGSDARAKLPLSRPWGPARRLGGSLAVTRRLGGSLALPLMVCFALCVADGIRADERPAAAPQIAREVKRLVAQLDADARSARVKAREALLALGPAILPHLPEETTITSAAAREAIHEIRLKLERESALASLAPSRVTLRGTLSLGNLLAQITSQTGNAFETSGIDASLLAREFPVDFHASPFWSACDQITQPAGIEYGPLADRRLRLVPEPKASADRSLAVSDEGAFRVAVATARIHSSVSSRTGYALRMNWNLKAEPRLRPLYATITGSDLRLSRSEGIAARPEGSAAALRPISPAARLELSMNEGEDALRLDSDFESLAADAPTRVDFKGSFAVEMAAGPERFVFDNLVDPHQPPKRIGSATVRLVRVEFPAEDKPNEARVEINLVYDERGPAFESYRTWMYRNEVWLEAKDGRRIRPRPLVATRRQDDGAVAVEYNFAGVAGTLADYRLVYVAPTLITQTPVQFQLRNIPVTRADHPGAQP
jgi:hypothetical protein